MRFALRRSRRFTHYIHRYCGRDTPPKMLHCAHVIIYARRCFPALVVRFDVRDSTKLYTTHRRGRLPATVLKCLDSHVQVNQRINKAKILSDLSERYIYIPPTQTYLYKLVKKHLSFFLHTIAHMCRVERFELFFIHVFILQQFNSSSATTSRGGPL